MVTRAWWLVLSCFGGCADDATCPLELRTSGQRLKVAFYSGEDGVRVPFGWFDTQLGSECEFKRDASGAYRCVPVSLPLDYRGLTGLVYLDSGCTQPAALIRPDCALRLPSRFVVVNATGCDALGDAYPLGPAVSGAPLFENDGDSCVPTTRAGDDQVFSLGPRLNPSGMVGAIEETQSAEGRLRPIFLHANDGGCEWLGTWDSQLEFRCAPGLAADGTTRCLPFNAVRFSIFLDPQCTLGVQPVVCEAGNFAARQTQACSGLDIFRLGPEESMEPQVYAEQLGTCTYVGTYPVVPVRRASSEVPPVTMAPLTGDERGSGRLRERIARGPDGAVVALATGWVDMLFNVDVQPTQVGSTSWAMLPSPVSAGRDFLDPSCSQPLAVWKERDIDCSTMPSSIAAIPGPPSACPIPTFHHLGSEVMPSVIYDNSVQLCTPQSLSNDPSQRYFQVGDPLDPTTTFVALQPAHE